MGGHAYNYSSRAIRTASYLTQDFAQTFEQQSKGEIRSSMNPMEITLREARDSEVHPNSCPIILGLDVTASMDYIPKHLITHGLPKLISGLEEKGIKDSAILFMGLGDSKGRQWGSGRQVDKAPLQIGQFESGDEQLDNWLTKTWIEGGGWGNGGESYAWSWWFAANRVVTDAWEKRKEKGFIFTVGDDKCHDIAAEEFNNVLNITHEFASREDLYAAASEKWNVYHLCLNRNSAACYDWKAFMGENCIPVDNHEDIPAIIAKVIAESKGTVSSKVENEIKITL